MKWTWWKVWVQSLFFVCVCVFSLLELWRVSGAQDPLFLPAPSCKLPLFPCIPRHPSRSVQTGVGLHHLGLQTHDEECGRHRSADSLHAAAERGPGGGSCPKLLPDVLLRHPTTHLLCGHRHVAHRWWASPLLSSVHRQTIRHSASVESLILGRYLAFSAISVIGRRVLTHRADRRRRPGFETLKDAPVALRADGLWFVSHLFWRSHWTNNSKLSAS